MITSEMIGTERSESVRVVAGLTAEAMESGDMPVYATPAMVALIEKAAKNAVAPSLDEGQTTVGIEISTSHVKASAVGAEVCATARLTEVDGRKLTFEATVRCGGDIIGEARHVRFVVDRQRFMSKL